MSNLIFMIIGFVGGLLLCYASDRWRINMLINKGYDNAVRDIFEYGCYYDKDNNRVDLMAEGAEDDIRINR